MRDITGFQVARYQNGIFVCIVSGLGKNRKTWDSGHSRSAAYRHARDLRKTCADADMRFCVETSN